MFVLFGLLSVPALGAGDEDVASEAEAAPPPPAAPAVPVEAGEEVLILGLYAPPGSRPVPVDGGGSLAAGLSGPGVGLVVRGGNEGEPVVRGMGGERVPVRVGGVPLLAACPSNMDPPAATVPAGATSQASLSLGLAPVSAGPPSTGGAAEASPYVRVGDEEVPLAAWAVGRFDSSGLSASAEAGAAGAAGPVAARAAGGYAGQGDYTAPDGRTVPDSHHQAWASLAVELDPTSTLRWSNAFLYTDDGDTDFPSLPMDMRSSRVLLASSRLRWQPAAGRLRQVVLRGGFSTVDHRMDNVDKSNRAMMEASTESSARAAVGGAMLTWAPVDPLELDLGLDVTAWGRDALRDRADLVSGMTGQDALWPTVRQEDVGGFVQGRWAASPRVDLRGGGRLDLAWSRADGAAASLGGMTVAEQYARTYGDAAADTERQDLGGAGNLVVVLEAAPRVDVYAGGGYTARVPGASERWFALAPAPGGYLVGNPTLPIEKKVEAEVGLRFALPAWQGSLALWEHEVFDFVRSSLVDQIDLNGDSVADNIRGYLPVRARLAGFEGQGRVELGSHVRLHGQASYVRGWDLTAGDDLPEIPPLDGSVALRGRWSDQVPLWGEVGMRGVLAQRRVAAATAEDETEGFVTLDAGVGLELVDRLRLSVRGLNLTDRLYHEHLRREVSVATDDLAVGDEIPAPGRSVALSLRLDV